MGARGLSYPAAPGAGGRGGGGLAGYAGLPEIGEDGWSNTANGRDAFGSAVRRSGDSRRTFGSESTHYWVLRPVDMPGSASRCVSITNLVISLFGTSLLAIPYAMSQLGVVLCLGMFVAVSLLAAYSYHLLNVCVIKEKEILSNITQRHNFEKCNSFNVAPQVANSSYFTLAERTMNFKVCAIPFHSIVDFVISVNCAGMAVGMLIVAGDNLPHVAIEVLGVDADGVLGSRYFWVTLWGLCVSLPLSYLKSLEPLKVANTISLVIILALVVIQELYNAHVLEPCDNADDTSDCEGTVSYGIPPGTEWYDILAAIGVLVNAYNATFNMPTIAQELKRASVSRMSQVVIIGILCATVVYAVSAFASYDTWGAKIDPQGDILLNFPEGIAGHVIEALVSVVLCVCVPMMVHPSRNSLAHLVFGEEAADLSTVKYMSLTTLVFLVIYGVSISGVPIAIVLGLMGGLVVIPLLMVLPPIFYLQMHNRHKTIGKYRIFAQLLFGFGAILGPVLTVGQILAIMDPDGRDPG